MTRSELLFEHMRRVICRLYFRGKVNGTDCLLCCDRGGCYQMVEEAIRLAEDAKEARRDQHAVSPKEERRVVAFSTKREDA